MLIRVPQQTYAN